MTDLHLGTHCQRAEIMNYSIQWDVLFDILMRNILKKMFMNAKIVIYVDYGLRTATLRSLYLEIKCVRTVYTHLECVSQENYDTSSTETDKVLN